jgi:hypothetical protein
MTLTIKILAMNTPNILAMDTPNILITTWTYAYIKENKKSGLEGLVSERKINNC